MRLPRARGGSRVRASALQQFVPKSILCLREGYEKCSLSDLLSGLTVGVMALPLASAFGIASHVTPQQGLYTTLVADS